jgi:Tfp pilus assembly protein PilV
LERNDLDHLMSFHVPTTVPITKQKGISLIEIPVALLVLALVIIMATRTFKTANRVQKDSHFTNQATAFASAKLNELEVTPLPLIANGQDQVTSVNGLTFTRKWTYTQPISNSSAKAVQVQVHWTINQQPDSVQVATLVR